MSVSKTWRPFQPPGWLTIMCVAGHGVLLRVPKQSQLGLSAASNLTYQAACFERAGPGATCPACAP